MLDLIKKKGTDKIYLDNGIITFLNPYSYLLMRKNLHLLDRFDSVYIDGEWLCKFLKWFNIGFFERRSFDNSSLAPIVFNRAQMLGLTVAIVGSDPDSLKIFIDYLKQEYKGLDIVYKRSGYFHGNEELDKSISELFKLNPGLLVVGMGAIKQEEYLVKIKDLGWKGVGFSCGGFIHQTAKKGHQYYPYLINKWNLRFVYRIWDEPKLIKRYTVDYIDFVVSICVDKYNLKKNKHD
jgi:exopolysaccharide biosynthesis WecB/TagA/CpsF family protein